MDHLRYVKGPLWVSVRAFLASDDVLYVRTTAVKWNIAGLYGRTVLLHPEALLQSGQDYDATAGKFSGSTREYWDLAIPDA